MDLDDILKALANPVRRDILGWLKDPETHFTEQNHAWEDGVCVGRIWERAGLSQSTVSAHMAVLERAGLVTSQRAGQWVLYKRDEKAIAAFLAAMKTDL
ncbi:ArsR/SmtB family transcription factor [Derxia gummosa]|uniref:ArsR/SmtB family transcription factor n=1 Tax=Derxia gummosa DSM 723 TaxID=1121388 RepID=A0A9U5CGG0_9BURK|nr:metalloregulator ArsR/SmtB family transcription factor [Derxia gummosa]